MPLLEVMTRCYKRPTMLRANIASLEAQTDCDWTQRLLVDDVGRGVSWANAQMADVEPCGDYVWMLDDDDECTDTGLVAMLRVIVDAHEPDVVMLRMDHATRGILPDDEHWGRRDLHEAEVGVSAPIVRRAVWMKHRAAWGNRYAGDYDYVASLLGDDDLRIYWHDVIASRVQRISLGQPE